MARPCRVAAVLGALLAGAVAGGCGSGRAADRVAPSPPPSLPPLLERLVADRPAPDAETVEVWVCDVPLDTTAGRYGRLPLRQPLTPTGVVAAVGNRIQRYFDVVSGGRYRVTLTAGGTVEMARGDDAEDCVDAALDRSGPAVDSVLAVATAEHVEGASGGWGTPGSWPTCTGPCPASHTRRAAYVGASDFHPDWGEVPLLDLIEHELGHTLGLPHSGSATPGSDEYLSALDLMSNSAAPRDVDADRRDGPHLIGVSRLDLGWIDRSDVVVAGVERTSEVELLASTAPDGVRLLVLPVSSAPSEDDGRIVTVEYLVPTGYNDHLPEAGVAVHLIDDRAGAGVMRVQQTIGVAPFTDLMNEGDRLDVAGWSISVDRVVAGSAPRVTVRVANSSPTSTSVPVDLAVTTTSR
ncbi:MAG: hypothetical protein RI958_1379 [Actinomycetota bacterium]